MQKAWGRRLAFVGGMLAAMLAGIVQAQGYPTKPIRLVLGYAPGGVADITARLVTQKLSASLGQQIVVDNRPSAGGIVAGEAVAKAAPDGYTLLHLNAGNAITVALFKSVPFDVVRDFAPIVRLGSFDILMLVPRDSKITSVRDLVAAATFSHLAMSLSRSSRNCSGVPPSGLMPSSWNFARRSGCASAAFDSRFMRSMTSRGAFSGAAMPFHAPTW